MSSMKSLAVRDTAQHPILPAPEEVAAITESLADLDYLPYGTIKMPSGGMKAFNVTEPGEEEAEPMKPPFEAVIIHSHKQNTRFVGDMGDGQPPACSSNDGKFGFDAQTGERIDCETCPHNQFGTGAGCVGKACKNSRRIYLLRPGDVFPMVLSLPATSLRAYDMYVAKCILGGKPLHGVVTSVGLKEAQNRGGVKYYAPTFEAASALNKADADAIKAYAEKFVTALSRQPEQPESPAGDAAKPQGFGAVPNGFKPVTDDDRLPF